MQPLPAFPPSGVARSSALLRQAEILKTPACAACHTDNPKMPGQNAKTGKPIDPMAVSANPARFTNKDDVEKWFHRNCKEVLGRECTAFEKGDFITFMVSQ